MPLRKTALALYSYVEFGTAMAVFLPAVAAAAFVHRNDPTPRVPGRWIRRFGRATVHLSPLWHFEVRGKAPADIAHRAHVVVANHESNADAFLLSFLPWDMRWVAKAELFRVPFAGQMLHFAGDIPLRRGDPDSVEAMREACRHTLTNGLSVMMFPEGTRSTTDDLGAFKRGAFELAVETQLPVLPISIAGTRDCIPKGGRAPGEARAIASILEPLETAGLTLDDVPLLRDRARDAIKDEVMKLRSELGY